MHTPESNNASEHGPPSPREEAGQRVAELGRALRTMTSVGLPFTALTDAVIHEKRQARIAPSAREKLAQLQFCTSGFSIGEKTYTSKTALDALEHMMNTDAELRDIVLAYAQALERGAKLGTGEVADRSGLVKEILSGTDKKAYLQRATAELLAACDKALQRETAEIQKLTLQEPAFSETKTAVQSLMRERAKHKEFNQLLLAMQKQPTAAAVAGVIACVERLLPRFQYDLPGWHGNDLDDAVVTHAPHIQQGCLGEARQVAVTLAVFKAAGFCHPARHGAAWIVGVTWLWPCS